MKITIEHNDTTVSIEHESENIDDVLEHLVKPALIAAGFHWDTVNDAMRQ